MLDAHRHLHGALEPADALVHEIKLEHVVAGLLGGGDDDRRDARSPGSSGAGSGDLKLSVATRAPAVSLQR